MRQRTANEGKEIKKGDMETETAGSEREREAQRPRQDPKQTWRGDTNRGRGKERETWRDAANPQGRESRRPLPPPTHILEERVSRGTGGWRGRPRGLGRGLPDQAHGEQPRARHGAAAGSGWAEAPARSAAAAGRDWAASGEGAPAVDAGARRGPRPAPPPARRAANAPPHRPGAR